MKSFTVWNDGEFSSWGSLLDWAKEVEKGGNLRPHLKSWSRGSGFHAANKNDEYWKLSSGFLAQDHNERDSSSLTHDKDGDLTTAASGYSTVNDFIARSLTGEGFASHFDSVIGVKGRCERR